MFAEDDFGDTEKFEGLVASLVSDTDVVTFEDREKHGIGPNHRFGRT